MSKDGYISYGCDDLYTSNEYIIYYDDIAKFQKLEFEIYDSSYVYIDKLLKFGNLDIDENLVKRFSMYINLFCRLIEFPVWFLEKYNVKDYHISLIRNSYFNYNSYHENENICHLDMKRPFGSSSVMIGVAEKYINFLSDNEKNSLKEKFNEQDIGELLYKFNDSEYDFVYNIYLETLNIIGYANKELHLKSLLYENSGFFSLDFKSTEKGEKLYKEKVRLKKLERILNDK